MGIDEAGRGSLIGPLVVGGFLAREDRLGSLREVGARDSKLLSADRREAVFASLARVGRRLSIALPAPVVDTWVRRGGGLNRLEAATFARLIRRAAPDLVYVDACDVRADRFGRDVARLAHAEGRVVSRHRADRDLPIVGAASIVAKVRRDRAIGRLRAELGDAVGSGYPSDERTCAFVRGVLAGGAAAPPWLRHSWATTERLMPKPPRRALETFG